MAASSAFAVAALPTAAPPSGWRLASANACVPDVRHRRVSRAVTCCAGQGGPQVPAKLAELWEAARSAPPLALVAGAAAVVAMYKVASGLLAPPPPPPRRREAETVPPPPIPEPVEVGEITEEELRQYDGSDPEKPLLMAIKGQIYDVSQSRMFYGPGGAYELFAGKDASRALAKMSFEPQDLTGDISGLTPFELSSLNDWEYKFNSKYVKVGTIRRTPSAEEGSSSVSPEAQEEAAKPIAKNEPEMKVEAEMNEDD
ncbi:hypothetical protein EJB05_23813 [Eragrostis curvula]|uniref:Cytochrome b5 heme-binding domain-containing protein n=1 Tax=Eragrostis curvula TaxID=38414 RepID=A0A5J9V812_9POAL|nr:hypothetical protein EJB05_23813 [Eragrostis curvula]